LITGVDGLPMTKERFGVWFNHASLNADVFKNFRGLRRTFVESLCLAGATVNEMRALLGYRLPNSKFWYADEYRRRLSMDAAAKLELM
jgi:hypothetical protein